MTILVVHGAYQLAGGEDQCVAAEVAMLEERGHKVVRYSVHNGALAKMNAAAAAARAIWNPTSLREVGSLVDQHNPEVAHVHNTFPLISPAVHYVLASRHVPVVQTLHNFRLLCPNALLYRNGSVCERCVGKAVPWPGVVRRCYRRSWGASAVTATMLTVHRALGTWRSVVDAYITPSEFARAKLVEGGLPADKVFVKPNVIHPDPGPGAGGGGYALFVGRLSHEKGLATLLRAWNELGGRMPLKIVGDGPLAPSVADAAAKNPGIQWLGARPFEEVCSLIGGGEILICPSECYETFGRVIVEAFSKGTPVIASNIGAMAELVDDGRTGLLFRPGDSRDLASKVSWLANDRTLMMRMRGHARAEFEAKYTSDQNCRLLLDVYHRAIAGRRGETSRRRDGILAELEARS